MENVKKYMLERFLKYVTFDTESCDDATVVPTTEGQFVFARYLEQQLKEMGLEDVVLDEKGYLYATLPANCDKDMPVVGFIAHLDMVFQERETLQETFLKRFLVDVAEGQYRLVVFFVGVVVVFAQVTLFFRLDHFFHQFHGRIVLARILFLFAGYYRLADHIVCRFQPDLIFAGVWGCCRLALIADHANFQFARFVGDRESSLCISLCVQMFIIHHIGHRQRLATAIVSHDTCYHLRL